MGGLLGESRAQGHTEMVHGHYGGERTSGTTSEAGNEILCKMNNDVSK